MPEGKGVWDVGASESQAVMVRIGVDAPPRKGADFRQVLDHEKGAEQLNHCGYLDDGCLGAIEGPVDALRQPSASPYREGGRLSVAGCFTAPFQGLSRVR